MKGFIYDITTTVGIILLVIVILIWYMSFGSAQVTRMLYESPGFVQDYAAATLAVAFSTDGLFETSIKADLVEEVRVSRGKVYATPKEQKGRTAYRFITIEPEPTKYVTDTGFQILIESGSPSGEENLLTIKRLFTKIKLCE